MSQICVIDGDYSEFNDLNDLIKQYTSKFQKVKYINSKDGSEIYKDYELLLNNNTTIFNNDSINIDKENTTIASTTLITSSTAPNRYHDIDDQNITYTCYLLNNFDNNNKIFTKLEDIQTKCSNSSHRFLIYGVPILRYCNELTLVSFLDIFIT
jgi:hypothetical protein